jgi:antitoxin (DNA-binding transcriptional repressor) of toxin-antitoxin stability system
MKQDPNITTVNTHEAKSGLSRLAQLVLDGKRVQIARHGKPVVELRPVEKEGLREPGSMKNLILVSEDFDSYGTSISDLFDC